MKPRSGLWGFLCTAIACATLLVCVKMHTFGVKYESDWRIRTMYAQYDMQMFLLEQQMNKKYSPNPRQPKA